jgi:hypothetical protein
MTPGVNGKSVIITGAAKGIDAASFITGVIVPVDGGYLAR